MTRTLLAACAAALLLASPASAMPTPVDIAANMNVDVVVGYDNGSHDPDGDTMDGVYSYMTESAAGNAASCGPDADPEGLPDDGFFPAQGPTKPGVDLPIDNGLNNDNALQITNDGGSTLDVPDGRWHELIVFASSGDGHSLMDVMGIYTAGSDTSLRDNAVVPDWHVNDALAASDYVIADFGDRMRPDTYECDDANDTGIYAMRIQVDPTRTLDEVGLLREDGISGSRLTIFGAVLIRGYTLTVTKAGGGGGTVIGPSLDCGNDCSGEYIENRSVTLSARPDGSSTFAGWSGGGCSGTGRCTVTMTAAKSVTATFDAKPPSGQPPAEQPPPSGNPPPGNPITPPPVGETTVRFNTIASAASRRGCRSRRRRLRVRVKAPPGATLRSATVTIGGRSRPTTGTAVSFRRVPRRAFRITVVAQLTDGRTLRATKRYRRCRRAARRRAS